MNNSRPLEHSDVAPGVAVVIPTFNSANVVGDAIESALHQTVRPDEIIVIDDGSTDDTAAAVCRFAPHVNYVQQINSGPAAARNHGARLARREWVAFLDADDFWLPNKLEVQAAAAARTCADVVLCALWWPADHGETTVTYTGRLERHALLANLLCGNSLAGGASTAIIRRSAFQAVGGFDSSMDRSEDRDLFIRLADRFRFAYVGWPLARRRVGPVAFGGDPDHIHRNGEELIRRYAHLLDGRPGAARIIRQARARALKRAGMDHLYRGNRRAAWQYLRRAVALWPFMADPWRVALNTLLGRLPARAATL